MEEFPKAAVRLTSKWTDRCPRDCAPALLKFKASTLFDRRISPLCFRYYKNKLQ